MKVIAEIRAFISAAYKVADEKLARKKQVYFCEHVWRKGFLHMAVDGVLIPQHVRTCDICGVSQDISEKDFVEMG